MSLIINADNVRLEGLSIEAGVILREISNFYISRCWVRGFYYDRSIHTNTVIDQCVVQIITGLYYGKNLCVKNSFFSATYMIGDNNFNYYPSFLNCVILLAKSYLFPKANYRNCIITVPEVDGEAKVIVEDEASYFNNVFIRGVKAINHTILASQGYDVGASLDEATRYKLPEITTPESSTFLGNTTAYYDDVFKYTDEETPLLAPIITTITGSDGKQVGPYGGTAFSPYPAIPRITESKINTYTDEEGKLSVKVKVEVNQ